MTIVAMVLAGCSSGEPSGDQGGASPELALDPPQRAYQADWLIDADLVGRDGPGYPYLYREVFDDANGRYLVQSDNHLAVQEPEQVLFCAAILRPDPYCAVTERAEGTPPVLAYPIQLLRDWGPDATYDLASHREVDLVASTEPEAWQRQTTEINGIAVECFRVIGETAAANEGFEVCYTDDELHLVASVDLQGDLVYDIDLITYRRTVDDEDFETGLEEWVEQIESRQDQLLDLFPEIPAPRPTPTPTPDEPEPTDP